MVVNEDLITEIVRPGTGDSVVEGDVGEIVVTSLDLHHPWIRLALGDLTDILPGRSRDRRYRTPDSIDTARTDILLQRLWEVAPDTSALLIEEISRTALSAASSRVF